MFCICLNNLLRDKWLLHFYSHLIHLIHILMIWIIWINKWINKSKSVYNFIIQHVYFMKLIILKLKKREFYRFFICMILSSLLFFEVNLVISVGCALYAYILNERTLSAQLRMRLVAFPTLCLLLSRLLRMPFNSFLIDPFLFLFFIGFFKAFIICLNVNLSYDFTKRSHIFFSHRERTVSQFD